MNLCAGFCFFSSSSSCKRNWGETREEGQGEGGKGYHHIGARKIQLCATCLVLWLIAKLLLNDARPRRGRGESGGEGGSISHLPLSELSVIWQRCDNTENVKNANEKADEEREGEKERAREKDELESINSKRQCGFLGECHCGRGGEREGSPARGVL